MTQQHPMVPPNILLNNWESDWFNERENVDVLLIQAYQAGADAELEACCEWIHGETSDECFVANLRAFRRPKPPSLKEQALAALKRYEAEAWCEEMTSDSEIIRRALEQLPDHTSEGD